MISINRFIYKRFNLSLLFFVISAIYGLLMRWQKVTPILTIKYLDVLQAHSHVTFLGWGFLSIITLVTGIFLSKDIQKNNYFKYSFWIMAVSITGMLISFPLQGYKLFSIVFLSLFLLSSYVYLWVLYKKIIAEKSYSSRFLKMGIFYYFLSSLGIWSLSIISIKIGKGDLYQNSINFYTHFLYNGFFVLLLFGLFIRFLEIKKIKISQQTIKLFFHLTNIAVIPTFALSLLWKTVPNYVVIIGFVGAIIQLFSLLFLWKILMQIISQKLINQFVNNLLLSFVLSAYILKLLMQFIGAFPSVTHTAIQFKSFFVIGYIHVFTLGFLSLFLFLIFKLLLKEKLNQWGIYLFIFGIVSSEILLFSQGILLYLNQKMITNFNEILLMATILMPLGLLIVLFHRLKSLII